MEFNKSLFSRLSLKYVRIGDLDYVSTKFDAAARQFMVAEIFFHPFYTLSNYNDIALLRLKSPIEFNEDIRPICLTDLNRQISNDLIVAGWGSIDNDGHIHSHLQRIKQQFYPDYNCQQYYNT